MTDGCGPGSVWGQPIRPPDRHRNTATDWRCRRSARPRRGAGQRHVGDSPSPASHRCECCPDRRPAAIAKPPSRAPSAPCRCSFDPCSYFHRRRSHATIRRQRRLTATGPSSPLGLQHRRRRRQPHDVRGSPPAARTLRDATQRNARELEIGIAIGAPTFRTSSVWNTNDCQNSQHYR